MTDTRDSSAAAQPAVPLDVDNLHDLESAEPTEFTGLTQPTLPRHGHRRAPVRRSRSRVPGLVWLATGLHICLLLAFTFLYPPYFNPDENNHVDRVVAAQGGDLWPDPGSRMSTEGVQRSFELANTGVVSPRGQRPSLEELGGTAQSEQTTTNPFPNQLTQHPPAYYAIGAGWLDLNPWSSKLAWDQTMWLLRLLSVVLMAPLPLLCWAAAKRLVRAPFAVAASLMPLAIPSLERIGAAVNNDNLLTLATAVITVLLVRVALGDLRRRTALAIALTVVIALLDKGFALVLPPVIALAYVLGWRTTRDQAPRPVRQWWGSLSIVAVGCVLGGLWWIRNLALFGNVQPNGYGAAKDTVLGPPHPSHGLGTFLHISATTLSEGFWGLLGLLTPPKLPENLCHAATALLLLLIIMGFALGRRRRGIALMLILPAVFTIGILLVNSWHDYSHVGRLAGMQGRYLYPGMVGLTVVAAIGLDRVPWRRLRAAWVPRALPGLVLLAALCMQALAIEGIVHTLWMHKGVSFIGHFGDAVTGIIDRSPWPIGVTLVPFGAFVVLAVVLAVGCARHAVRTPTPAVSRSTYQA